jgi:dTDP-4-amino-4,6-dideoxygalactose transaminase
MSEVSAAMGLTSLESLNVFIETNHQNYLLYKSGLENLPGIRLIQFDENETNNYQYIVLEVDDLQAGINRDMLLKILHAENVRARRYFYPGCHKMEPYRSYYPNAGLLLPQTEKLTSKVLQLPTGTAVGEKEIMQVCNLIRFVVENGIEINARYGKEQETQ